MPSFTQLLTAISDSWRDDHGAVTTAARNIASRLAERGDVGDLAGRATSWA